MTAVVAGMGGGAEGLSGQWVEEPGKGWVALAVYHQDTRDRFGIDGDTRALSAEGRAVTTSSFLTMAMGLAPGVDLWSQFSFHRLRYDDVAGRRSSTGIGDARLWVRAAPLRWLGSKLPFAIRAGFKVPVGDFDVDAEVIPLGDGQRDWEAMAELGHSFWPRSLYLSGWVGYRWREENVESRTSGTRCSTSPRSGDAWAGWVASWPSTGGTEPRASPRGFPSRVFSATWCSFSRRCCTMSVQGGSRRARVLRWVAETSRPGPRS